MGSLDVAKSPKLINERTEKLVFPFVDWSRAYYEGYSLWSRRRLSQRLHVVAKNTGRCAAEKRKQFPPSHSITSSARARSVAGIVRPRAFAVFRLITSSNFVGCCTGRSWGLAPFKILST